MEQTAKRILINDLGPFMDSALKRWCADGATHEARDALKVTRKAEAEAATDDLPLFRALPDRAFLPERDTFVELRRMRLQEWRSAAAFKRRKSQEIADEAERMERFEVEHLELWEVNPDWSAEHVAAKAARRGGGKAA